MSPPNQQYMMCLRRCDPRSFNYLISITDNPCLGLREKFEMIEKFFFRYRHMGDSAYRLAVRSVNEFLRLRHCLTSVTTKNQDTSNGTTSRSPQATFKALGDGEPTVHGNGKQFASFGPATVNASSSAALQPVMNIPGDRLRYWDFSQSTVCVLGATPSVLAPPPEMTTNPTPTFSSSATSAGRVNRVIYYWSNLPDKYISCIRFHATPRDALYAVDQDYLLKFEGLLPPQMKSTTDGGTIYEPSLILNKAVGFMIEAVGGQIAPDDSDLAPSDLPAVERQEEQTELHPKQEKVQWGIKSAHFPLQWSKHPIPLDPNKFFNNYLQNFPTPDCNSKPHDLVRDLFQLPTYTDEQIDDLLNKNGHHALATMRQLQIDCPVYADEQEEILKRHSGPVDEAGRDCDLTSGTRSANGVLTRLLTCKFQRHYSDGCPVMGKLPDIPGVGLQKYYDRKILKKGGTPPPASALPPVSPYVAAASPTSYPRHSSPAPEQHATSSPRFCCSSPTPVCPREKTPSSRVTPLPTPPLEDDPDGRPSTSRTCLTPESGYSVPGGDTQNVGSSRGKGCNVTLTGNGPSGGTLTLTGHTPGPSGAPKEPAADRRKQWQPQPHNIRQVVQSLLRPEQQPGQAQRQQEQQQQQQLPPVQQQRQQHSRQRSPQCHNGVQDPFRAGSNSAPGSDRLISSFTQAIRPVRINGNGNGNGNRNGNNNNNGYHAGIGNNHDQEAYTYSLGNNNNNNNNGYHDDFGNGDGDGYHYDFGNNNNGNRYAYGLGYDGQNHEYDNSNIAVRNSGNRNGNGYHDGIGNNISYHNYHNVYAGGIDHNTQYAHEYGNSNSPVRNTGRGYGTWSRNSNGTGNGNGNRNGVRQEQTHEELFPTLEESMRMVTTRRIRR
ncbi:hypothetical protein KEM54_003442 [Ascosphaera aggregata]|nr:hypothetical protein KEM54_003442 [Ascosphaera aggregata]